MQPLNPDTGIILTKFEGLEKLLDEKFDRVDDHFTTLNTRVGKAEQRIDNTEDRVEKAERSLVTIKAYWTAGLAIISTGLHSTIEYMKR